MHAGYLKCAFLGGLIVFCWQIISWMGLPWHMCTLNVFNNEADVAKVVMENISRPGVYVVPNIYANPSEVGHHVLQDEVGWGRARPLMFSAVQNKDMNPRSIPAYIGMLITYIIAAYFISVITHKLKQIGYMEKVGVITLLGLTIGVMSYVPACIWWGFSTGFTMVGMLDLIIEWFFAGLVIAKLSK